MTGVVAALPPQRLADAIGHLRYLRSAYLSRTFAPISSCIAELRNHLSKGHAKVSLFTLGKRQLAG